LAVTARWSPAGGRPSPSRPYQTFTRAKKQNSALRDLDRLLDAVIENLPSIVTL